MNVQVSVILPAYNAEAYIKEAIESVLNQSHHNWELIIVDDGSTDHTLKIAQSFTDTRILVLSQKNQGVGSARNHALQHIKGEYFCFLDADDILPKNAIKSRLAVFEKDNKIAFVSGRVTQMNADLSRELSSQTPTFRGMPEREIVRLSSACLVAITWLIKRKKGRKYHFPIGWTHSEDVAFFLSISQDGLYDFTEDEVLIYRRNEQSAMSNLDGLKTGYIKYFSFVKETVPHVPIQDLTYLKNRIRRIMFLSYLRNKQIGRAIKSFIEITRL